MSHADVPPDGPAGSARRRRNRDDGVAAKVVLMELAAAGGPLSAEELGTRTLLAVETVEAALEELRAMGFCHARPADDRRPARYLAADPPASD